ncbi:hypothetical protein [Thermoplasma sp.]|uniref:hypothetical protein n=1 Tax=Thermoplasma sp. TaxID=1973142 RepID=UPI00345BF491
MATLSTLLIHILTNTSLSASYIRRRTGSVTFWIAVPTITTILMSIAYYYSIAGMTMPYLIAPIIFVTWIAISVLILHLRKDKYYSIDFFASREASVAEVGGE